MTNQPNNLTLLLSNNEQFLIELLAKRQTLTFQGINLIVIVFLPLTGAGRSIMSASMIGDFDGN
jgi:hypothetical protein